MRSKRMLLKERLLVRLISCKSTLYKAKTLDCCRFQVEQDHQLLVGECAPYKKDEMIK